MAFRSERHSAWYDFGHSFDRADFKLFNENEEQDWEVWRCLPLFKNEHPSAEQIMMNELFMNVTT